MNAERAIAPVTPINENASTTAELVAQRVLLKADIADYEERIAQIDALLIERLDTVGAHDVDGTKVTIREYSRTDYSRLEKDYPADSYPDLYVTKTALDQAAVKKSFAPAALDTYKVRGAKSVVV